MAAHPGELRLTPEVTGSPRRVSSFSLKSFGGPGKPEASLGELGSRKLKEKPGQASLKSFEQSFVLCGN